MEKRKNGKKSWYIYLIRCADDTIYTGITTSVAERFALHQTGKGAKYLRGRGPLTLIFQRRLGSKSLASKMERRMKSLPRIAKIEIGENKNKFRYWLPAE